MSKSAEEIETYIATQLFQFHELNYNTTIVKAASRIKTAMESYASQPEGREESGIIEYAEGRDKIVNDCYEDIVKNWLIPNIKHDEFEIKRAISSAIEQYDYLSSLPPAGVEETKKCVGCGYDLPLSYFNPKEKCYLCDVSTALPLHEEDEQTEPYPTLSDGRTIDWQAYHEDKQAIERKRKPPMTIREVMEAEETKEEGCAICGGQLVLIRGIYPGTDKRSVCPTCNTERLEQIYELASSSFGKTYKNDKQ